MQRGEHLANLHLANLGQPCDVTPAAANACRPSFVVTVVRHAP
jgi:hypothetical protein